VGGPDNQNLVAGAHRDGRGVDAPGHGDGVPTNPVDAELLAGAGVQQLVHWSTARLVRILMVVALLDAPPTSVKAPETYRSVGSRMTAPRATRAS
jgi:hypothetical protein